MDRHDLYELCVQSPRHLVPFLRAIHGGGARVLGEDFAGTAALSAAWVEQGPDFRAVAVDLDPAVLRRRPEHPRLRRVVGDVRSATDPARDACDLIYVGNFSIGEIHARGDLVAYLARSRRRLRPGGVFVCDTYGGESAFLTGAVHRDHLAPDGRLVRYTWEQRRADPLTGEVVNALHFRVSRAGVVELDLRDAFVYRWRLWSVPELRDALAEAGFARTEVYSRLPSATDEAGNAYVQPVTDPDELDDSFIVCVAARA